MTFCLLIIKNQWNLRFVILILYGLSLKLLRYEYSHFYDNEYSEVKGKNLICTCFSWFYHISTALIDIAKLPKLVQSDETIPESPDEMAYYGSVTDTEAGSELGPERSVRGSVYSFAKKGRDSSLPELDDLLEKRRQKSAR